MGFKFELILEDLLTEAQYEDKLKSEFLDSGKVPPNTYEEIMGMFPKSAYNTWLLRRVADKIIKPEDVYKFKDYIETLRKYPKYFSEKDINRIVSHQQVRDFIARVQDVQSKIAELRGGKAGEENVDTSGFITPSELSKLESVGIKFLGVVDGYQSFEVPNQLAGNEDAWKVYKEVFGRCKNREHGEKIHICTLAAQSHFDNYLTNYPGSSYYVFYNINDSLSPYQFHYESNQFMDKNDRQLI